jgi:hypothetical protein
LNGLPLVLANPWGALALLGLPAVVAIHCLQQKSRKVPVSTLFLLEHLAPESREGRWFILMRGSLAFWLQILSVLILTWVLVEPRWFQTEAVQRVVLVLDDSISMRAFSDDIVARTSPPLRGLAALASRTYWTVLETDPTRPTLYEGGSLSGLEEKLRTWAPSLPANDPTRALGLARTIAPHDALVVFVTDRPRDLPTGVDLLAIGEPIENCGLVGMRLLGAGNDLEWQVMAQNYGRQAAHRSWWLEFAGTKTDPQTIELQPGHPQLLQGKFPPGVDRLEVCLQGDRFSVDDRMPMVRPQPKPLALEVHGDDATADVFARLTSALPSLVAASPGAPADLAFDTLGPQTPFPGTNVSSVVLYDNPGAANGFTGGPFVADDNPLDQDLNWQGLIVQPGPGLPPGINRQVLLWKNTTPLIYIRPLDGGHRQLVFNFNFPTSNAARLPAFVLLINRFVESLRLEKRVPEIRHAELAEKLTLAANSAGPDVELRDAGDKVESAVHPTALTPVRAPRLPGYFTISQGNEMLLTGAAQFADARESDFSTAATLDTFRHRHATLLKMHTRADASAPLWLILIGLLLVVYWGVTSPRRA